MDFDEVDRILSRHGLTQEPAFDQVGIDIRQIPDMNGCPLGLYYPDSGNIVIPPDGYESVLLHELGHRHGHYYYNNLSEPYAEDYRRRYQKGSALMYSGGDFARLPKFDALYREGEKGIIAMAFSSPPYEDDIVAFQERLGWYSQGEPLPRIVYSEEGQPTLAIHFTKGVDWLSITGIVLGGMFVAGMGAIGYAIYKVAKDTPWILPLAIFGTLAGIALVGGVVGKQLVKQPSL